MKKRAKLNRKPAPQIKILPTELRPLDGDELAVVLGGSDDCPTMVAYRRA